MKPDIMNDTIAAIATPPGEGGIGIVRLSGEDALKIADKIFFCKDGKKPSQLKTYTIKYGWVKDSSGVVVDEVILSSMRAPRSYTREDVVEINCHGGIVPLRRVLELVLDNGARLAEPGEFNRRAFLNGRIDLAQAEAVLDIIRAKTDSALRIGTEQLKGSVSRAVNNLSKALLDILAVLEAGIDFPDEDIEAPQRKRVRENLCGAQEKLKELIASYRKGKVLREGIHAVICGKPNAGKSSLLNALLKQERSIVTPVAGTTRDTVEEIIDIKGIPVRFVDTAGIIEPRDLIEKKAVQRSRRFIRLADLVILVFDGSKALAEEDCMLIRKLKGKSVIAIINKVDLKQKIEKKTVLKNFSSTIELSAKKLKSIAVLEEEIVNAVYRGKIKPQESVLVSNARHAALLKKAEILVAEAVVSLDNNLSLELISQSVKEALVCLDGILGKHFSEDLLDKIFGEFCIGK